MDELNELDERIAKLKKELEDDKANLLMKDWAAWDAEHGGNNDKDSHTPNASGGYTHKSDAAATMYGAGSKQHMQAISKWGQGDIAP